MIAFLISITLVSLPFQVRGLTSDYFLVGSVEGKTPVAQEAYLLRDDDRLIISLVESEGGVFISSVKMFIREGQQHKTVQRTPRSTGITWSLIQPRIKEYSNLWEPGKPDVGSVKIRPIEYIKVPLPHFGGQNQVDFRLLRPREDPGTFYICVEIAVAAAADARSPAVFQETAPLHLKFPYRVIQISYRTDDSYFGYLTELFRTPFLIAPMITDHGAHQTDERVGSDCAAFAVYGKRRQGFNVPYSGPNGIYRYLSEIEKSPLWPGEPDSTGSYVNETGDLVRIGAGGLAPGDIVHFGEQVSVFYADAGIPGVLDKDDLLIQCYQGGPSITTIEKSGFYHRPIRIFKWRDDLPRAKRLR